jgi:PAS domain S-box-containing protein
LRGEEKDTPNPGETAPSSPHGGGEAALRASLERYQLLFQRATDGIWLADQEGWFVDVNPAACGMLGYSREEHLRLNVGGIVRNEEETSRLRDLMRELAAGHQITDIWEIRRADGTYIPLELSHAFTPDGLWQVIGRDITERKHSEEALRESEEHQTELRSSRDELGNILGGVADGVTAQDPTGRVIYANEAAARMVGYPSGRALVEARAQEVMERFEVLDEEGRPFPLENLPVRRALAGEERAEELLRFRSLASGEERWSVVTAVPVFDEGGRVRIVVNVLRDVSEQRRAEERRARLAAIVESSDDAIIGKTVEGIITNWNRAAERIYGYTSEDAVGQHISMLVPAERPNEIPRILEILRRGEKIDHFETVRVTKDGRRIDISLTVSPIRNSAGDVVGASTIARDITERRELEEERKRSRARELTALAEAAERERISRELHDRVAHHMGVAHQSLELYAALREADPERAEERLALARESARLALDQTRALSAELKRLQQEELAEGLGAAFRVLTESFVPNGVEVDFSYSGDESAIPKPVEMQAYLAMREALRNAVRHSGCSRIGIRLEIRDGEIYGLVEDNGKGFDTEGVGKATPSWGVGLRSMRERAEMFGGTLRVDSRPRAGTRVELRVPLDGLRP